MGRRRLHQLAPNPAHVHIYVVIRAKTEFLGAKTDFQHYASPNLCYDNSKIMSENSKLLKTDFWHPKTSFEHPKTSFEHPKTSFEKCWGKIDMVVPRGLGTWVWDHNKFKLGWRSQRIEFETSIIEFETQKWVFASLDPSTLRFFSERPCWVCCLNFAPSV